MVFIPKIRPISPQSVDRRAVAVHEAAHCIIAAYLGGTTVAATIRNGRTLATRLTLEQFLVMTYAGYWADMAISSIPEPEARRRSTRERTAGINELFFGNHGLTDRSSVLKAAKIKAETLVKRFTIEIKSVATLLEQKEVITSGEFETIDCVKQIRAIGERERELEQKKPTRKKPLKRRTKVRRNKSNR